MSILNAKRLRGHILARAELLRPGRITRVDLDSFETEIERRIDKLIEAQVMAHTNGKTIHCIVDAGIPAGTHRAGRR